MTSSQKKKNQVVMVYGNYSHISRGHLTKPIGSSYAVYQKLLGDSYS